MRSADDGDPRGYGTEGRWGARATAWSGFGETRAAASTSLPVVVSTPAIDARAAALPRFVAAGIGIAVQPEITYRASPDFAPRAWRLRHCSSFSRSGSRGPGWIISDGLGLVVGHALPGDAAADTMVGPGRRAWLAECDRCHRPDVAPIAIL